MEEKAVHAPSISDESDIEREHAEMLANDSQRGTFLGFYSLPESLRHIVAEYISVDKRDSKRLALLGKTYNTLCFSQHANLKLGSCWHVSCLSPKDRWQSLTEVRVDLKYLIKDYQICLDFLGHENLSYWPFAIEVLVFQLDISSQDFSTVLDDLQDKLVRLQPYLISVQHVIFAIEKHAFCCFSFNDVIGDATRRRQTVNRLFALKQILVDLRTCWITNQTLSTRLLLDYYILSDGKPKSDIYLSNFVISLSHCHNRDLFDAVDPNLKSNKLMWIYSLETPDEVENFDQRIARCCHAFHLDTYKIDGWKNSINKLPAAYFFADNPFIERIVIDSRLDTLAIQLPRPLAPLTDFTPRSALIELTLKGDENTFDLTQLNNGYFPNLTHLSIVGGKMRGHLDSHHLPRLKTFEIALGSEDDRFRSKMAPLARKLTQAIVDTGRPWQLVAFQDQEGWSLASYDEATANPQDEEKEDAPHFRPIIRELMLVMETQENANECQSKLNGHPAPEAIAEDQKDSLLVWAPECVEKITAFSTTMSSPQLEFKEEILGKTRILTSLTCYHVSLLVDGGAMPELRSLEMQSVDVELSGAFPKLRKLCFQDITKLLSPWEVNAPLLESLHCHPSFYGKRLSLRPELLPHLSSLRIELWLNYPESCPLNFFNEDSLGLSRVKHVVFGSKMTSSRCFDWWHVHNVSQLEVTVDPLELPGCWENTEWQCETLTINIFASRPKRLREEGITVIKMPPRLPRVKKLTVTEKGCPALLDSEMLELIDLMMPSPQSLGPNLKCPALRCIFFTDQLSDIDKEKCLDPTTYEAISAQPRWVYFGDSGEVKQMSWDKASSATGVSTFAGPL